MRSCRARVGFLAGCFDLIHPGYIKMFEDAKSVCDHLIVALQIDPTIDRPNSHKEKPIHTLEERKIILSAITFVDQIETYTTEDELYTLLTNINIDVRILGTDYIDKPYTGDNLDIPIHFHKRDHCWSATNLRNKIRSSG
jgi:glycerol-3-phosphate cytidylyltransferase